MPEEGDRAPLFSLTGIDETGRERNFDLTEILKDNRDVILYFYPRDNTPGCTTEACDFRDNFARIKEKAMVLGVSPDTVSSHKKFMDKHNLNFPLLSDPDHRVMEAFEAWGEKKMYGKITKGVIRSTYIIDKEGVIKKRWKNVKAKGHVEKILDAWR